MAMINGQGRGGRLTRRAILRRTAWGGGVLFSVALASCGGASPAISQTGASSTQTATASTPVVSAPAAAASTAQVAGQPSTVTWFVRSDPVENPWEQKIAVPDFEKQQPQIKINLIVNPSSAWNTKILAMYAGGQPPDVHNGIVGTFIQLYSENKVTELTPYIQRDKFDLTPFGPLAKDPDMCRSGKQWELPILTTYGSPLYYNMDLFDKAGLPYPPTDWSDKTWTMDKVLSYAQKLTANWGQPNGAYGLIGWNQFHAWSYLWGVDCWSKNFYEHGIAQHSNYTDPKVVEALQFSQDLIWKYKVSPRPEDQTGMNQLGDPFKTGRIAMTWGSIGYWNYPDITAFKWGVAAGPWKTTNKTVSFTDGVMISGMTKVPEQSWLLVKYLVGQDGQRAYIEATHTPPTRQDNLDVWLNYMLPKTGMKSQAALKQVALGYSANYIDNWAHYTIDAGQYQTIQTQEGSVLWGDKQTSTSLMPTVQQMMDSALMKNYNQYKSTRLSTDALCMSLNFGA